MTYSACKKVIQNGTYGTKEDMQTKLDIFLLNNRLSQPQYEELTALLAGEESV